MRTSGDELLSQSLVAPNVSDTLCNRIRVLGRDEAGRWYLELARRLDTGHGDDAVIPAAGAIEITFAVANGTTGGDHSVSGKYTLKTDLGS